MKKILIIFLLIFIISCTFILTSCNNKPDLYNHGIEVTTLMGKMVKNNDFLDFLNINAFAYPKPEISNINAFIANDYDTPIRTYLISAPQLDKVKEIIFANKKDTFENLPEEIQKTFIKKIELSISDSHFIPYINGRGYYLDQKYSWEDYIIASDLNAIKEFNGKLKEPLNYLYLFETGQPIIVNFTPKDNKTITAIGKFALWDCSTLSAVRETFEPYGCTVSNL